MKYFQGENIVKKLVAGFFQSKRLELMEVRTVSTQMKMLPNEEGLTQIEGHAIVCTRAEVAQLVEHSTENASVVGSIPSLGTFTLPVSPEKRSS